MKISFDELQAFKTMVETGSITAASGQLGQSVSGVSRTLSRLEKKVETTLLQRTTRRIELTEEGKIFLEHARAILTAVNQAEEQMARRRLSPSGKTARECRQPLYVACHYAVGSRIPSKLTHRLSSHWIQTT